MAPALGELGPMDKLKLHANTLRHRAAHVSQHYGRERAKYQFDLIVENVENLPYLDTSSIGLLISCARGPKVATTTQTDPSNGMATWNEKISFICTMYESKKGEGAKRWSEKSYRVSVQSVVPGEFGTNKKKLKEVAFSDLDVAQYATGTGIPRKDLTLRLGWTGKPLCYTLLRVQLSCTLVSGGKNGPHSVSDARSISSNLTDRTHGSGSSQGGGARGEQSLRGFDENDAQVRRAAATRNAKMGNLSSIRESLASKLSRTGTAGGLTPTAGQGESAEEGSRWDDEDDHAPAHRTTPGGHARAGLRSGASGLGATPNGANGFGRAGIYSGDASPLATPPVATQLRYAADDIDDEYRRPPPPPQPYGGGAPQPTQPRPRTPPDAYALASARDEYGGGGGGEQVRELREQLATLGAQLDAADDAKRRSEAECARLRENARALTLALDDARDAQRSAERGSREAPAAAAAVAAASGEQLRSIQELRAQLQEADEAREEGARELERLEHVNAKLRLALTQLEQERKGAGHGSSEHAAADEAERTELQIALVDAKMALATMEYEREEAMHTVRTLKQELERSTAGNMKVAKEMTWLEVKYTEARSELARVKHHNASLEEDVKDMVGLKLELAEATQRIAELESGRGGDDLM